MFIFVISRRDPLKLETPITLNGTVDIVNKRRIRGCHFSLGYSKDSNICSVEVCMPGCLSGISLKFGMIPGAIPL